jgi:hypothetical protein
MKVVPFEFMYHLTKCGIFWASVSSYFVFLMLIFWNQLEKCLEFLEKKFARPGPEEQSDRVSLSGMRPNTGIKASSACPSAWSQPHSTPRVFPLDPTAGISTAPPLSDCCYRSMCTKPCVFIHSAPKGKDLYPVLSLSRSAALYIEHRSWRHKPLMSSLPKASVRPWACLVFDLNGAITRSCPELLWAGFAIIFAFIS